MQTWSRGSAVFQTNVRMGCDLSDCGMIFGARQGSLNISETTDLLNSRICREWCEKQEHSVSSSSACKNTLLMREVRGEGPDGSKLTGK